MSIINEKQAAEELLYGYAAVLNRANPASVSSFYAFDGLFMPEGFKTLTKKDLEAAGGKFLQNNTFKIEYDIQSVTVGNEFAFIEAAARTTTVPNGGDEIFQNSRDFFVLRKDGTDWKIYRYLFNKARG